MAQPPRCRARNQRIRTVLAPSVHSAKSLTQTIVDHFHALIGSGKLQPGMKVPSIRSFAESRAVSVSTVVDAYDRLVADGVLVARQNLGFFVRGMRPAITAAGHRDSPAANEAGSDARWPDRPGIHPGCGGLPPRWLDEDGMRRTLRALALQAPGSLTQGGPPRGYLPLRRRIADDLNQQEVYCEAEHVLTTNGAADALQLAIHHLIRPADTVIVDAPGYPALFAQLKRAGARVVGIPVTPTGPDPAALAALFAEHRPKAYFANPRLHNPTGVSWHPAVAHRVLRLASQHDVMLIEDDACGPLDNEARRPLASLDQLEHVIYVGSFSKTLAPGLRTGYLVAHRDRIDALAGIKAALGPNGSDIAERFVYRLLADGRYRKLMKALREQISAAHGETRRRLIDAGMIAFGDAASGLFVWARHPRHDDARTLARSAMAHDIGLAPGDRFMPDGGATPWLRFNVGHCGDARLYAFLAQA